MPSLEGMATHHHADWSIGPTRPVQPLGRPVAVPGAPGSDAPVSMAMHLHAAFSEKTASYEAHLSEARRLGVDVLWWTDHDFRVNAYGYREAVHFDGLVEEGPTPNLNWTWVEERDGSFRTAEARFVDQPHSPDEPGRAMRLTAAADEPATMWFHGESDNLRYSTCLADTTVELDVRPERLQHPTALLIEIQSSYHPAGADRPAGRCVLRYRVTAAREPHLSEQQVERRVEGDGLLGVIDLQAAIDRWRRLVLRPVEDIAALWPDLVAEDNSLVHLRIGVTSAGGVPADVVVDRLRFVRSEREGRRSLELRRRILDRYADRFPTVRQYESLEISLTRHLNWFGGDLGMLGYPDGLLERDDDPDLARGAASLIHDHGGLVSWNHPLARLYGQETKEQLAAILLRTNALDCDVIEVGNNPDLDEMLWVFDVACRNGIFITASGVSDDHTGEDWVDQPQNYLTHVWSESAELPDVLDALASGRSWFAQAEWRGAFEIEAAGVPAMGGAVITSDRRVEARVTATDLPADATVEIVTGALCGAESEPARGMPATTATPVPAARFPSAGHCIDLQPGPDGCYLRAQLRDADGIVTAASNPLWALPLTTGAAAPASRRVLDPGLTRS